jgi:hypothetical protein
VFHTTWLDEAGIWGSPYINYYDSIISSLVFCAKSGGKASISDFAQDKASNPHTYFKKTLSNYTLKLNAKYFDLSKNVLIRIFHRGSSKK